MRLKERIIYISVLTILLVILSYNFYRTGTIDKTYQNEIQQLQNEIDQIEENANLLQEAVDSHKEELKTLDSSISQKTTEIENLRQNAEEYISRVDNMAHIDLIRFFTSRYDSSYTPGIDSTSSN
jgi:peptidoglycan hydrolase CwlO-like protein